MADKAGTSAAESAAGASTAKAAGDSANGSASTAAPKKPGSQGNPAFRMMGTTSIILISCYTELTFQRLASFTSAFAQLAHLPLHYRLNCIGNLLRQVPDSTKPREVVQPSLSHSRRTSAEQSITTTDDSVSLRATRRWLAKRT